MTDNNLANTEHGEGDSNNSQTLRGVGSKSRKEASLTTRQRKFCELLVLGENKTQSVIKAGFSKTGASTQAYRLLQKATIRGYIAKLRAEAKELWRGSVEQSARNYEAARVLAMKLNRPAAAVAAQRWMDGLFGLQSGDNQREQTMIVIQPPKVKPIDVAAKEVGDTGADSPPNSTLPEKQSLRDDPRGDNRGI